MATQKEVEIYRAAVQIYTAGLTVPQSIDLAVEIWEGTREKLYNTPKDSLGSLTEGKHDHERLVNK